MSGIRLKECVNPMRSRQSKISSQAQQRTHGLITATTTQLHPYS